MEKLEGRPEVSDLPLPLPDGKRWRRTTLQEATVRIVAADGTEMIRCVYCDFLTPSAASVVPHLRKHSYEATSRRSRAATKRNKANGARPTKSKHVLRLNVPAFNAFMARKRITSETAMAAYLEVGVGTVQRARQGEGIGGPFVSALKKKAGKQIADLLVALDDVPEPVAA